MKLLNRLSLNPFHTHYYLRTNKWYAVRQRGSLSDITIMQEFKCEDCGKEFATEDLFYASLTPFECKKRIAELEIDGFKNILKEG